MFPVKEFEKRFREILAQLDELRDLCDDDQTENIEEMNAEYEDALFVIECIDINDEEWTEEFSDALEEFKDLLSGYQKLAQEVSEIKDAADRLDMVIKMAEANLKIG